MEKKTVLITGPTSGIGKITAFELAKRNYNLILLARNPKKAEELQKEIGSKAETSFVECDLADLASVAKAIEQVKKEHSSIDVLLNNAGLMMDHEEYTKEGIEMTFAVNHLGHFLLTNGLIDLLAAGKKSRIVHVSSEAHRIGKFRLDQLVRPDKFSSWVTYGNSKLANILFSNELAERLKPVGITSNSLHPGGVATNFASETSGFSKILMYFARPFFKSPEEGARTSIYLASSPKIEGVTHEYFSDLKIKEANKDAQSKFLATKLWQMSEELVKDYAKA
jgi:NAD(P)-dependent dehydrogenase (short-subunit alcohol dehydrogenase family)